MAEQTLLVFAHGDEADAFARAGVPHLITGVGKINATFELTRAILDSGADRPAEVIVLGTAGAISPDARLDTVYRVSAAIQHDYSLPSPTVELPPGGRGPAARGPVPEAVIATGDVFVQSDAQREELAARGASLVDMESYAYAQVCRRLGVPLRIYKTPSDFADDATTMQTWDDAVVSNSDQLLAFARERLPELFTVAAEEAGAQEFEGQG